MISHIFRVIPNLGKIRRSIAIIAVISFGHVAFADQSLEDEYQIAVGDTVRVSVFGHDDLSKECQIDNSGRCSLPLINYVDAAGLTAPQLEQAVIETAATTSKRLDVSKGFTNRPVNRRLAVSLLTIAAVVSLVFLFVVPLLIGIAMIVVPLQIGAPSLAFPRAASAALWSWAVAGVIMVVSWAIDGGLIDRARDQAHCITQGTPGL